MSILKMDYGSAYIKPYLLLTLIVAGSLLLRVSDCASSRVANPYLEIVDSVETTTGELLAADSELSLFAHALENANLIQKIDENSSVLVFAPTNFGLLDQGSAFLFENEQMTGESESRLLLLLKTHIVDSASLPADFASDRNLVLTIKTLSGYEISTRLMATEIIVGRDAFVTKMVKTSNGMVMYVDRLLLTSSA